jgi:glutathione S-transferase
MGYSLSERVLWLAEELGIEYKMVKHTRAPNGLAPQSIKDLHPLGQSPVIQVGSLTLAESTACVEYVSQKFGNGKFILPPSHANYADYLYWFHFAASSFHPHFTAVVMVKYSNGSGPFLDFIDQRGNNLLKFLNERLATNTYLAGEEFTLADIMIAFPLMTQRTFLPIDLSDYTHILSYLKRLVSREGFKKCRAKGDPDMELMIDGKPPKPFSERGIGKEEE